MTSQTFFPAAVVAYNPSIVGLSLIESGPVSASIESRSEDASMHTLSPRHAVVTTLVFVVKSVVRAIL